MKTCTKCGESKPLAEFHTHKNRKDGYASQCKACVSAAARIRYLANREAIKAKRLERYYANREAEQASHREYHREHGSERYYERRDYYRAKARQYYRANKARWSGYGARRRRAIEDADPAVIACVVALKRRPCVYCRSEDDIEIDHIVPIARGGKHEPANLAPACRSCNRSKGAKLVSEWQGV